MKFESFGKISVRTGYVDRSVHVENPFGVDNPFQVNILVDKEFEGSVKNRGRFVPKKSDPSLAFVSLKMQQGVKITGASFYQCQETKVVTIKIDLEKV